MRRLGPLVGAALPRAPTVVTETPVAPPGTESRTPEWPPALWSATLYYAQGLPFGLVRQLAVVFFRDQGASLQSLGLVSLYGLPWTLKFLWSPWVDTVGSRRRWVVTMQAALTVNVGGLTLMIARGAGPRAAALALLLTAVLSATHDVASDGFYLEALDRTGQARFSGWIVAAYRLALLTAGGFLVSLAGTASWAHVFLVAALILAVLTLWHGIVLPRPGRPEPPAGQVGSPKMLDAFRSFLGLPGIAIALAFVVLFKLGDALLFGMSTPFLLDAGMTKGQLGAASGIFGTIAAIGAGMGGGWFISKYSLRRGLWYFGFVQNVAILVYALVAWVHPGLWGLTVAVIIEQAAAGLGTAAYSNFLMRQNRPQFKATHYAIVTGMMSLTTMLGGAISGFGAQAYGYAWFFTLAFVASLPGLLLVPFVARRPECR
jgi:MFS transporter, PAT family, beta-lactamase induction signal transducer AmpG